MKEMANTNSEEKKKKLNDEIGNEMMIEKYQSIEKQINAIKESTPSHQAQIFCLRKQKTNNGYNGDIEAIVTPFDNKLLFYKEEILKTTLMYASCVLQNNHPAPEFTSHFEDMKRSHDSRMKKKINDEQMKENSPQEVLGDFTHFRSSFLKF